jgi:hypothetical protein
MHDQLSEQLCALAGAEPSLERNVVLTQLHQQRILSAAEVNSLREWQPAFYEFQFKFTVIAPAAAERIRALLDDGRPLMLAQYPDRWFATAGFWLYQEALSYSIDLSSPKAVSYTHLTLPTKA